MSTSLWRGARLFVGAGLVALASACGSHWVPVTSTGASLRALPAETEWIRARGITDDDASELARFRSLATLSLYGGKHAGPQRLTARGFAVLADGEPPVLTTISISLSDSITDDVLSSLSRISTLETVTLRRCGPFGQLGLRHLATLPRLRRLDIRGCAQVDDDCLPALLAMPAIGGWRNLGVTATGLSEHGVQRLRSRFGAEAVDADPDFWRGEDPAWP